MCRFFGASVNTCIIILANSVLGGNTFLAANFRDSTDIPRLSDAFQKCAFPMNNCDLSSDGWALTSPAALKLLRKLENIGVPLGEYVDEGFHMGVKTGCNDAFIIDESVRQRLIAEDAKSDELIKPVLRGRKLKKWRTDIVTGGLSDFRQRRGIDIEQ